MTRFLSESLNAQEPFFRLGLKRLEAINGNPSQDIRLSAAVLQQTQSKLRELGLDPTDTTATELYHALNERVKVDDARLTRSLQTYAAKHVSAEADVGAGMVYVLTHLAGPSDCFALKATSLRTIIKKLPPKKAMKRLGYRSIDSFLKHESQALVLAAAWLSENHAWQQHLLDQYKRLKPIDFEMRQISIIQPDSKHWRAFSADVVEKRRHNLLSLKEIGAIVLLPLPMQIPAGAVTVSLSLALHELNEIRAASTFLKLCQVRPDFGSLVRTVASDEPSLSSEMLDQPAPWHLIQRYYAGLKDETAEQIFESHVRKEDMFWQPIEQVLSRLDQRLAFWHDSAYLGLIHNHQPVSLNIIDVALNLCNKLPFEKRVTKAFQRSLWHELLLQYLKRDKVEQTVLEQLQPKLATQAVEA